MTNNTQRDLIAPRLGGFKKTQNLTELASDLQSTLGEMEMAEYRATLPTASKDRTHFSSAQTVHSVPSAFRNLINVMMGFIFAMGLLGLTGFVSADDSGTPATPPSVCATGIWKGTYTSTVFGSSKRATLRLVQERATLKGEYSNSVGCLGSVSGIVSGNTAIFTISVTTPGCSGSFAGTGAINTINPVIMIFTYKGAANTSCGGSESGAGILMKQI